jgi:hypothetical protein
MNSLIALHEFEADEYRNCVRSLSDEDLVKEGKKLRFPCGDVVTAIPSVFRMQSRICREEYWRRHLKLLDFLLAGGAECGIDEPA